LMQLQAKGARLPDRGKEIAVSVQKQSPADPEGLP